MRDSKSLIPSERIEQAILFIRSEKVILDEDLASLYGVTTKRLNEQVSRNIGRFPADFMFQLTKEELRSLKSHFATSKRQGRGGRRTRPRVFTEHGILMLSSVLRSKRAIQVNIEIMRAFVRMRQMISSQVDLLRRLEALELRYDKQFKIVFDAIRQLMAEKDEDKKRPMGFGIPED